MVFWLYCAIRIVSRGYSRFHSTYRGSFRIRKRTPWSPKFRERDVDSASPGKDLGEKTSSGKLPAIEQGALWTLTGKGGRYHRFDAFNFRPSQMLFIYAVKNLGETNLSISKRVNWRRYCPSTFTDRSPKTKNPPSEEAISTRFRLLAPLLSPVLSWSLSLWREDTSVPARTFFDESSVVLLSSASQRLQHMKK